MRTKSNIEYNEETQEYTIAVPDWLVDEYSLEAGDAVYWEEIEDEIFTVSLNNN